MIIIDRKTSAFPVRLLMEEILHHLGCIKPCEKRVQLCSTTYISTVARFLPLTG